MKIGIQLLAYNCHNTLKKTLYPWLSLKNKHVVDIWVASGQFKIYHEMGCKNENEITLSLFKNDLYHVVDYLFEPTPGFLLSDHETRSSCLKYFKESKVDVMIMLDSDEHYTVDEVSNLIDFIQKNNQYDWYTVNFKNLIGDGNKYVDFEPVRVIWFNKDFTVKKYYFDNHMIFEKNGIEVEYRELKGCNIPKSVLNPLHYTWTDNMNNTGPSDIKKKMEYQKRYYSHDCGWSVDEKTNSVIPNENFWGDNKPELKNLR